MAFINVPGHSPRIFARWAMRMLAERVLARLTDEGDRLLVTKAVALEGLDFELLLEAGQRRRIASAYLMETESLRLELLASDAEDELTSSFVDLLGDLALILLDAE